MHYAFLCYLFANFVLFRVQKSAFERHKKGPELSYLRFSSLPFTQLLSFYKMGFADFFGKDHEEVHAAETEEHKAKLSHQAIAGAAAYEALKAYNEHCEKNGKPVEHAKAKQILAGFVGGALDRLVETKGLDFIDKQKAKHHAEKEAEEYYNRELQ